MLEFGSTEAGAAAFDILESASFTDPDGVVRLLRVSLYQGEPPAKPETAPPIAEAVTTAHVPAATSIAPSQTNLPPKPAPKESSGGLFSSGTTPKSSVSFGSNGFSPTPFPFVRTKPLKIKSEEVTNTVLPTEPVTEQTGSSKPDQEPRQWRPKSSGAVSRMTPSSSFAFDRGGDEEAAGSDEDVELPRPASTSSLFDSYKVSHVPQSSEAVSAALATLERAEPETQRQESVASLSRPGAKSSEAPVRKGPPVLKQAGSAPNQVPSKTRAPSKLTAATNKKLVFGSSSHPKTQTNLDRVRADFLRQLKPQRNLTSFCFTILRLAHYDVLVKQQLLQEGKLKMVVISPARDWVPTNSMEKDIVELIPAGCVNGAAQVPATKMHVLSTFNVRAPWSLVCRVVTLFLSCNQYD